MALCERCAKGVHHHTRYGPNASEVRQGRKRIGDMAECGRVTGTPVRECDCPYRLKSSGANHCPTCQCVESDR